MKRNILVTAGPTREKIDPIRFLSNESSGYLGWELARQAKKAGHRVTLILGPTSLPPLKGVRVVRIESAAELLTALRKELTGADYLFMTAAVSDFTPETVTQRKIKRQKTLQVRFKQNPDILKLLSNPALKQNKIFIGFCLETSRLLENAKAKLIKKNLDYIVATLYKASERPFGESLFSPAVLKRNGQSRYYRKITKLAFAKKLLKQVLER